MDIITKFDRIEDILGSPDGRYFGNGYTQVKYFQKVKHITFEGIESVFEINYPKSWSTKKNIEHETATNNENIPNISTSRDIEVWKQVTKAIHQEKSKAIAELWHSGSSRAFSKTDLSLKVSTPSGYIGKKKVGSPLSVEEINLIVQKFAEAARKAQISGFDGVDIHAAHGSLIHDFLTAETNQRTDEFGFKNRTYFAERVIKECRKVVGDNFPIFIRLSNFKSYDPTAKLAKTLE